MIKSMTGYGKAQAQMENIIFNVEIRTLNSRYKDIIIRIPQDLQPIEMDIRSLISNRIGRGRVEVYIKMELIPGESNYELILNEPLARAYMEIFNKLSESFSIDPSINMDTFCHLRDVIVQKPKELDMYSIKKAISEAIDNALDSVEEMRRQEGAVIEQDLLKRLYIIKNILVKIRERAPVVINEYRSKLKQNISKLLDGTDIQMDENRINQEVAIFAERSDITEEIVRIESHLLQFQKYLKRDEPVGRKLDFLAQEMNREINTISAKASDALISTFVVEIKGEIEKLREQVQNIE